MDRYTQLYLDNKEICDKYDIYGLLPCVVIRDHIRYRAVIDTSDKLVFLGSEVIQIRH